MQTTGLRQLLRASGYGAALFLPALLIVATEIDEPYLVFGTVMLLFPMTRLVFGAVPSGQAIAWRPWLAEALDQLPVAYFVAFVVALAITLGHLTARLESHELTWAAAALGWSLSLWMMMMFATCVAHTLIHAPGPNRRRLGHMLAGLAGYPLLGYEHVRHHRMSGNTHAAEWPRMDESVWRFAARRLRVLAEETISPQGLAFRGDARSASVQGLRLSITCTAATAGLFAFNAGWVGLAIYCAAAALVSFSVQLVTYMQHWGLGDDHLADARAQKYSWDSDCRLQAWLTMGLSLHQHHHHDGAAPYYESRLAEGSPRHPAGYVLLMVAALVPSVWRRVMHPVLQRWVADPRTQPTAGRGLTCIAHYK